MTQLIIADYLLPISAEKPTGRNLREDNAIDSLYYQIKDARNDARDIERKVLLDPTVDQLPDWKKVANIASDILQNHSKDIEVACWLIEAQLRLNQFSGLATGFKLLTQLITHYWESLYPLAVGDDMADRVIAITALNGEDYDGALIQPIFQQPITSGSYSYALWQYQQAIENTKKYGNNNVEKKQQGVLFVEDFQAAATESGANFYQQLQNDLSQAKQTFSELHTVLVEKCQNSAPPTSQINTALENFSDYVRFITSDMGFNLESHHINNSTATEITADTETIIEQESTVDISISNAIDNRHQALEQLATIANFFRQTEPQSPLPNLLDRAVRWGNMPFNELLNEIIKDDTVRKNAYELIGLQN